MSQSEPRLQTPAETAARMRMSKRALLAAAAEGIVPCVRIGRRVLFDREAIDAFIKSGGKAFEGGWRRERAS
jgi:excisionase family DNA binding protein